MNKAMKYIMGKVPDHVDGQPPKNMEEFDCK